MCVQHKHSFSPPPSRVLFVVFLELALLVTIVAFLVKIQLLRQIQQSRQDPSHPSSMLSDSERLNDDVLLPAGNTFMEDRFIYQFRTISLGWSFAAAIICLVLTAVAIYVYVATANSMRQRRKSMLRRQKFHAFLMQSCQNEVALATRVRMVIRSGTA